jgi:hypothetical protein
VPADVDITPGVRGRRDSLRHRRSGGASDRSHVRADRPSDVSTGTGEVAV